MTNFNKLERSLLKLFDSTPNLKNKIKYSYAGLSYIFNKKFYKYIIHPKVSLKKLSSSKYSSFWGYYNKSPIYNDNFLCHSINSNSNKVNILLNNKVIAESGSWNYQQGSMLNWLNSNEIIFNDIQNNKYISKIIDINNLNEYIINFPIYSISPDKRFALSLNFSRLAKLNSHYGYYNLDYDNIPKYSNNDGVYLINLLSAKTDLILSLEDIINFQPKKNMQNAWHKINHIEIAPDNNKFMFLHRWQNNNCKFSRLIVADINGNILNSPAADDIVSHSCWKSQDEIISWCNKKKLGLNYYNLNIKTNRCNIIGKHKLTQDGHATISKCKTWLLTDTYPDKSRMSKILLYNLKNKDLITLGAFYTSLKYFGNNRCDLHPRWNPDFTGITFDGVFEGKRQVYEMDLTFFVTNCCSLS